MRWALEQFVKGQWVVVSRHTIKADALRAQSVRSASVGGELRVSEKPLA
ncbi:MAG: hypothetical protein ACK5SX_15125 [Sandaracinobacter sp.]